jgi:hypothetical protein
MRFAANLDRFAVRPSAEFFSGNSDAAQGR